MDKTTHAPIVLLVDDHPETIAELGTILSEIASVHVSKSGEEALALLKETELTPDLILLDIKLPGMDGFETFKALREQAKYVDIPVMFITAHAYDEVSGLEQGALDFIRKPFFIPSIRFKVVNHLKAMHAKKLQLKEAHSTILRRDEIDSLLTEIARKLLTPTPLDEIANLVLDSARILTDCRYGFVGVIDNDKNYLISYAMTKDTIKDCKVSGKEEAFINHCSLLLKDGDKATSTLSNKPIETSSIAAMAVGHVRIDSFMSVPAKTNGKIVGQIALANAKNGFSDYDLYVIERLADLFALSVMRNNYEESLFKAKQDAERALATKTNFLSNMSHELRTPLNGILAILQILEDNSNSQEDKDHLSLALHSTKRLSNLLTDILDYTHSYTGKTHLILSEFNIKDCVQDALEAFTPLARSSGNSISLQIQEAIPDNLKGDPFKVRQIINNILGNALKFTNNGKVNVEISQLPSPSKNESHLLFTISDTGIGMSESYLHELFEPFSQESQGFGRKYEGAGLGLSISKLLVELMGGNLVIESKESCGTVVRFSTIFQNPADNRLP